MIVPKDVYLYIAQLAGDKTTIKMLSVNKQFNNKYHEVFHKKYPLLASPLLLQYHKKKSESWRDFYTRKIYYIDKMKTEKDWPYMPLKNFDPESVYKRGNISPYAAEIGNLTLYVRNFNINNINNGNNVHLVLAAENGHLDIVKFICKKLAEIEGFINFNLALDKARKRNQTHVIAYLEKVQYYGLFFGH